MFLSPLFLALTCLPASLLQAASQLLQEAGNSNDDHIRQSALEKMATLPSLDTTQRKEAASLADFAKRWNGPSLKFYGASMRGKPYRALGDYDFGVAADSPLKPLCEFYRGRMLAWNLIENSNVRTTTLHFTHAKALPAKDRADQITRSYLLIA